MPSLVWVLGLFLCQPVSYSRWLSIFLISFLSFTGSSDKTKNLGIVSNFPSSSLGSDASLSKPDLLVGKGRGPDVKTESVLLRDSQWAASEHVCICACVYSVLTAYMFTFVFCSPPSTHSDSSTFQSVCGRLLASVAVPLLMSPVCARPLVRFAAHDCPCICRASSPLCSPSPAPALFW